MKSEIIKNNSKTVAHVYLPCINYDSGSNNKTGLMSCLSEEIENSDSGYAGFNTKENLNDYLQEIVFDKADDNNHQYTFTLDEVGIIKAITKAIPLVCNMIKP